MHLFYMVKKLCGGYKGRRNFCSAERTNGFFLHLINYLIVYFFFCPFISFPFVKIGSSILWIFQIAFGMLDYYVGAIGLFMPYTPTEHLTLISTTPVTIDWSVFYVLSVCLYAGNRSRNCVRFHNHFTAICGHFHI